MDLIADRFEIEQPVGAGGMGEVFRARDRLTGQRVALKLLFGTARQAEIERFVREGAVLSEVSHPHIVRYVAHGVARNSRPWLAMEWLEGEDLAERLEKKGLDLRETLALGGRLASALGALHERGIVHRDVKPSNVFLVGGDVGEVRLLDFGVVRLTTGLGRPTESGAMVGTPGYMAPEQARGQREVDARADVFALGCMLFECLTGRPAFQGESVPALLARILLEPVPRVVELAPHVPVALGELVERMLAKHPAERPPNADAVGVALAKILPDSPQPEAVPSETRRAITHAERKIVSIVMAKGDPISDDAGAEPVSGDAVTRIETGAASFDVRSVGAAHGGDTVILADGSILVTLTCQGGATEQVAQAASCALAMRPRLPGATLALATGFGTMSGRSVMGEVIERAAGLLAAAHARAGGTSHESIHGKAPIFLDDTTAGLLDTRFDVGGDARGLFIRGLREREGGARTVLGKATPCVGREREAMTLRAVWDEVRHERVSRAVIVNGAAGVGKSRVARELVLRVEAEGARVWTGRTDVTSMGSPFLPITRAIRGAVGISADDRREVKRHKLLAGVGRFLAPADVPRVTAFLGELAGVPADESGVASEALHALRAARLDPVLMQDQIQRAWEDWVRAECKEHPVLMVMEDLHWGDLPTVRLLDATLRNLAEEPVLVMALARPEVKDLFPQLWAERHVTELRLAPLTRKASLAFVKGIFGDDLAEDAVEAIVARGAGNPFFLEELARSVEEGGEIGVPGSVLVMLEARIERLSPSARRVLRAASIFGETFSPGGVAFLLGGSVQRADLVSSFAELAEREVIVELPSGPRAERDLAFRHVLVREAVYATFTAEDRELGHRMAADWLEREATVEPARLAEHHQRGGRREEAARYYGLAARQAFERCDFPGVEAFAGRAGGILGDVPPELEVLLAETSGWKGDSQAARRHGEAALARLEPGSAPHLAACAVTAEALLRLGETAALSALGARVEADADTGSAALDSARVVAICRVVRELVHVDTARAFAIIAAMEAKAGPAVEASPLARAFLTQAQSIRASFSGDLGEEAAQLMRAAESFVSVGDLRHACVFRRDAAFLLIGLADLEVAKDLLDGVVRDATRLGLERIVVSARQNLGRLHGRRDEWELAFACFQEAIAGFERLGDRFGEAVTRAYLATSMRVGGDLPGARREIDRALGMLEGAAPSYVAGVSSVAALICFDEGKVAEGFEAARRAHDLLVAHGGTVEGEFFIRVAWADALHLTGRLDEARDAIRSARRHLLDRANKITDAAKRRSFLTRMRENVRILAKAGEWLADG